MKLGIHAARAGGAPAFMANVALMVCSMMYMKLSARPMPRYMPMPPLRLREDRETPIMVRMNEAKDEAIRLWYSTSVLHDVLGTTVNLLVDVLFELWGGKCLLLSFGEHEVYRLHLYQRVQGIATGDIFPHAFHLTDFPVCCFPMVFGVCECVVLDAGCCHVGDKLFVLKLVKAEAESGLVDVVVMLYVRDDTFVHLQLHIVGGGVLLVVLVHGLEILPHDISFRYDIRSEIE